MKSTGGNDEAPMVIEDVSMSLRDKVFNGSRKILKMEELKKSKTSSWFIEYEKKIDSTS